MRKIMVLIMSLMVVSAFAASTHLSLDNRTGMRVANATERICFSPAWETDAAGATAVVSTNGVAVKSAAEAGVFEWTPAQDGLYQLTHAVYVNGVQVGETLTATFVKGVAPRGCDWSTGIIELGWYADAKSLNAITYSVYWSESDDPASCVGKEDHRVGTKVFAPSKIGVQELTISDDKYLTHGDGLKPIYYHVVGTDGYHSCSRRMRNRHGLFVGIDTYEDPALLELGCCKDDAQKWRDMYTANLGTSNPRLMTDSECTKEAVLGALGDFAAEVQVGDVFLYTHSGHGDNGLLRCTDSRKSNAASNISATEFANALKQFRKGVGVVVVLDACSSGSIPSNMNAPRLMMAVKSNSVQDESASRSFAESVISAMDAAKRSPRLLMSAVPTALQSSSSDERITSGLEIGWLTAVNESEDSVDGVFSGSCLRTAGWTWGGADRKPVGNDDAYVDFGELGRFAKYWCGRMYDQYEMSPQMFSESILNHIRAGKVTYRNSQQLLVAPQNVTATTGRNDGIEVTWDPVAGARDYWVCFSDGKDELHSVFIEENRCLIQPTDDYSVDFGQPFQIYVKAWNPMDVSERSATVVGVRSAHYTLKFDANGGVGEMPDEEFVVGVEKSLPLNAFVREGYTFGGWGLAPNSVAAAYEDGEVVTDVCMQDGASDILYAMWIPDVIKVTFNYGPFAGKFGPRVFDYTVGTVFHDFPIVTSTKWDIKGWYTARTGGVRCQAGEVLPFTKDGTLFLQAEYLGSNPNPNDDLDDVLTDQLTIGTEELPSVMEMEEYEEQLECSGGVAPYWWSMDEADYLTVAEESTFAEVGEAQGWYEDEGEWVYDLPFAFNFGGRVYDSVVVNDNACLYFATGSNVDAIEMDLGDLYSESEDQDIFVERAADHVTFRWKRVLYSNRAADVNCAITLNADGTIRCSFGDSSYDTRQVWLSTAREGAEAEQSGNDDIVFVPNYLPLGLRLDEETGVIYGAPEQAGHYAFNVYVSDDEGAISSKRLTLDVEANPNLRPVAEDWDHTDEHIALRGGESRTFSVSVSDPEGEALTYCWYYDGYAVPGATEPSFVLQTDKDMRGRHSLICEASDGVWFIAAGTWSFSIGGEQLVTSEDGADALQVALDNAVDGDVIYVGPGTYSSIEVPWRERVRIVATDGCANTIIDGGRAASCVNVAYVGEDTNRMVRLEGFTLRNGCAEWGGGAQYAWLVGCVVSDNEAEYDGGGLYGGRADSCLIVGNSAPYGGGACQAALYNCTVVENCAEISGGGVIGCEDVVNTIVWRNYEDGALDPVATVEGDPLFVDAENGDYRLAEGSPCIGMGDNDGVFTPCDLDGNARIQDGSVDLGAFEYCLATPPVEPPEEPPVLPEEPPVPTNALPTIVVEAETHVDVAKGEKAPYEDAAAVYDGYLYDGEKVVGSVQVKVARGKVKNGQFEAKVTATVQLAGEAKKLSFKGGNADEKGAITEMTDKNGNKLAVTVGVKGLGGTFRRAGGSAPYQIDGARNVFSGKSAEDKSAAEKVMLDYMAIYNVAFDGGTLSVTVGKKGKVKVSGTVDGNKVSATSQLVVGDGVAVVPVVIVKKVNLSFCLWLDAKGEKAEVRGATTGASLPQVIAGKAGTIASGAKFGLDEAAVGKLKGWLAKLYADYLPNGLAVAQSGKKWIVADNAKAGKLVLDKATGALDSVKSKITANTSGLKLIYKEKDGTFKGSFKVYNLENGTKIKSYTANVTGVLIGSTGYGTATIKKVGTVSVKVAEL